jgi:membrane protein DedA with SNARE-associated domain
MDQTLDFLLRYGYSVLFLWVALEQIGLPIPSVPLFLAAGALAATGRMSLAGILGAGVVASLVSDLVWYEVGRRRGMRVLSLLCRWSLEPDSCVRRTEDVFSRRGASSLLVAKFIPGLSTMAPPLAGIVRMSPWRFLLLDGLGAAIWVGVFAGLGLLFSQQLAWLAERVATMGSWLLALLLGGLAAYILWKWVARHRFLRRLRIARITPEDLRRKLEASEDVAIFDLRHALDFETDPYVIPGAVRLGAEELDRRHQEIPRDREIILYCT